MSADRLVELKGGLTPEKQRALNVVTEYLALGSKFENPPQVTLEIVPANPNTKEGVSVRDIAITTAVQCYAPGDAKFKTRPEEKFQKIADSTLEAGHHTTRMHAHYTFHLTVTRDLTEKILHFTPFYNSEQQSQRYVEAKEGNYEVPANLTPEQHELYIESANYSNKCYFDLLQTLHQEVSERMKQMYPEKGWNVPKTKDRLDSKTKKICQEVARYVLPIAQKTTMKHTLSEIQILRLFRASQFENFTDEAKYTVARMIEEIARFDPTILQELELPIDSRKAITFNNVSISNQKREFDRMLDNKQAKFLGGTENPRKVLAIAVRNMLGRTEWEMSDTEALKVLMDPRENSLLSDVYETGMFDPLTSCLRQVSFTFAIKESHTAESQRQRQRRNAGATPPVDQLYDGKADYITPLIIRENHELKAIYEEIMSNIYSNVNRCLEAGIPREAALKLLPNAHVIRAVETGDLFDWLHRVKQRLCYLAQEEIFFVTLEEAEEIFKLIPEAQDVLLAPCGVAHRAGTGKCPEGDRWCGKPVWKYPIYEYKKSRLV